MHIANNMCYQQKKIIYSTGMALFAMFFGAGNIIFPIYLGANSGENIIFAILGFLLAGVGVPFLGLWSTSMYDGDYKVFFNRLGKIPGFLMVTFLMVLIGPLVAIPRTEITAFNILSPYLPNFFQNELFFSIIYCSVVFLLTCKDTKVVEILGLFLSPIKIVSFILLILLGFVFTKDPITSALSASEAFRLAISQGYSTMDMLATFFYCSVAFKSIHLAVKGNVNLGRPDILTLKSCIIGVAITSVVYIGFMLVAYLQAPTLQNLPEEMMLGAISNVVLGKFGGFFVCVSVSFACMATALSLAEVSSEYLHVEFFNRSISKIQCLVLVMVLTVLMSKLGFQGILKVSMPLVNVLYPALIVLCIMNILYKCKGINSVKMPFLITFVVSFLASNFSYF